MDNNVNVDSREKRIFSGISVGDFTLDNFLSRHNDPSCGASHHQVVAVSWRDGIPPALAEVVLLALRRDPGERFADAHTFAQALRWSREQSPAMPLSDRGAWVMGPRPRGASQASQASQPAGAPQPAQPAQPAQSAEPPDDQVEEPAEGQSTVLRVASHMPGIDNMDSMDAEPDRARP